MKYYKFTPLLKTLIWGTESWLFSGVPGSETLCEGKNINELVREEKEALVGEANYKRFGDEFPLLVKFIDAHRDLSIQVHPNDEIARQQGKDKGKTEMWYVLESAPEASLYNGLKIHLTPDEYKNMVEQRMGTVSSFPQDAFMPFLAAVICWKSSRPVMSPTAFMTTTVSTKTGNLVSCTSRKLQNQ